MKKLTYTTAILMAIGASSAFAHHPAASVAPEEVYEMIDANVADTPHADLVMDEMGSTMDQAAGEPSGAAMQTAEVGIDPDAAADQAGDAAVTVDTIDLMENVADSLAQ